MSHFTVLVVTGSQRRSELERALAPFQENCGDGMPREFLAFHDVEDEYRAKYRDETVEMVRMPDGALKLTWDDAFRVPGTFGVGGGTHQPPARLERVRVRHCDRFATFEAFMADWVGHDGPDPETGRYGYWQNPNAKWDYWTVGGRWSGMLRTRGGAEADRCRVADLDLAALRAGAAAERAKAWDAFAEAYRTKCAKRGVAPKTDPAEDMRRLNEIVERLAPAAREAGRPLWALLDEDMEGELLRDLVGSADDDFGIPLNAAGRDAWAAAAPPFSTFAYLVGGEWREQGRMGWFGRVADDKGADWDAEFNAFLDSLAPEQWVTVVDCHV